LELQVFSIDFIALILTIVTWTLCLSQAHKIYYRNMPAEWLGDKVHATDASRLGMNPSWVTPPVQHSLQK